MNRALVALALFALAFGVGLFWLRARLPAPELPAAAELFPVETIGYLETRTPQRWLDSDSLAAWPALRAALRALPLDALAGGLIDAGGEGRPPTALLLFESRDPLAVERALRAALAAAGGWREEQRTKARASWSLFHRAGSPELAFYRGASTLALALGREPLERLIASKRHGGPSLADRPGFVAMPSPDGAARSWWEQAAPRPAPGGIHDFASQIGALLAPAVTPKP